MGGITTNVEVSTLFEESVDFSGVFFETVLDVDLVWSIAGEGCDELEVVAKGSLVFLRTC